MDYPPIVDETKTWLAINPIVGCNLGCTYCFKVEWSISNTPTQKYDVYDSVKALINHPLYSQDIPLSINICSTDPFLSYTRKYTFEALDLLNKKGVKNIVGLTTKVGINEVELEKIEEYESIKIVVIVSLAGIPRHIEPASVKKRIKTLRILSQSKIPSIHYFRPIVLGWNDGDENIQKILSIGQRYSNLIAIGGFRNSKNISKTLSNNGVQIPLQYSNQEFSKKTFVEIIPKIKDIYDKCGFTVPLVIRTKCAIKYLREVHYKEETSSDFQRFNCFSNCTTEEMSLCTIPKGKRYERTTNY